MVVKAVVSTLLYRCGTKVLPLTLFKMPKSIRKPNFNEEKSFKMR